jgi:hypothetical protein
MTMKAMLMTMAIMMIIPIPVESIDSTGTIKAASAIMTLGIVVVMATTIGPSVQV